MDLRMSPELGAAYRSKSQFVKYVTESWAACNLFCSACDHDQIAQTLPNTKAIDFRCIKCDNGYQLKAGSKIANRVPDGAYSAMMAAITADNTPNLLLLEYSKSWFVWNLQLIPSFLFNASLIEKRKPLSDTARRAGWVGCNINLAALPVFARINLVHNGLAETREKTRAHFDRLRPLATLPTSVRGWTLDVLKVVQTLKLQNSHSRMYTILRIS